MNASPASSMVEAVKRAVRIVEAAVTPRRSTITDAGQQFRCVRSVWWHDAHQSSYDAEIRPYFAALDATGDYRRICDAGAAIGLFAVAACAHFPAAHLVAFEPSRRQRIVLKRNLRLNGVASRVDVVPLGLWRSSGVLEFRTHGAISAFKDAAALPPTLAFNERVRVAALDDWTREAGISGIDLIKMDIEGAEIEALDGARETLRRDRPDVLVQAYHQRDGSRTFERCADVLRALDYDVRETPANSGLLHARVRRAP